MFSDPARRQKPTVNDPLPERVRNILREFRARKQRFEGFTSMLEILIRELIPAKELHKLEARTKSRTSLRDKLLRPESTYDKLDDIPDISGVRIVTYFADDVSKVYRIIEREFKVLRSADKTDQLEPDQFGYISFHCVVILPKKRARLTEQRKFANIKAEIQIRSILQHAWAEIEHNLGYKSTHAVPRRVRRPFSRLAGLLELGDAEFKRIRDEVKAYEREVERGITKHRRPLPVDKNSLAAFIKSSEISNQIDSQVHQATRLRIIFSGTFVETFVLRLAYVGVDSINAAERMLVKKERLVTDFLIEWFRGPGARRAQLIPQGIALSFLAWVIVLERGGVHALFEFLNHHAFNKNQNIKKLAADLDHAFQAALAKSPSTK